MKIKISAFFICFCATALFLKLDAQSNASNLQAGVSGSGVLTITDGSSFSLGGGKQMNVWLRKMLNKKNGISFNVGCSYLGGFDDESLTYTEKIYPNEQVFETSLVRLNDLTYLDAGLSWYCQPKRNNPWSLELGVRASYLIHARGLDFKKVNFTQSYLSRLTETDLSGGAITAISTLEQETNVISHLNNFDIGIQARLYYQIISGIQIHAGFYQGFNSVVPEGLFPDTDQKLISSFNMGFTARLF